MYRVLTGVHPFTAPTPVAVLTQHLTDELVPPSKRKPELHIAARVEAIIMKCMAKRRDERYASADELKAAIAEAASAPSQKLSTVSQELRRASDRAERGDPSVATPIGAAQPLRREDFDAYERGLKRRRWLGLSIVPIGLVLGVAAFVVFTRMDPEVRVRDYESEPNNTPATANTIASGRAVHGQVGKRVAVEESDRDFYRFRVEGSEPKVLRAELSGIPNMELMLEVFDGTGKKIAEADNGGVGDGEIIPNLRLTPGEHYIAVREVWTAGRPATENVSDWYSLTATWKAAEPGHESEPDDVASAALPVTVGETVRGTLGRLDDVDYYYVRGDGGGTLAGEVTGVPGADLRVVVLPAGSTMGPPGPLPPGAKVFDAGGVGAGEKLDGVTWSAGTPGPLVVIERKLPRVASARGAPHDGRARHRVCAFAASKALRLCYDAASGNARAATWVVPLGDAGGGLRARARPAGGNGAAAAAEGAREARGLARRRRHVSADRGEPEQVAARREGQRRRRLLLVEGDAGGGAAVDRVRAVDERVLLRRRQIAVGEQAAARAYRGRGQAQA